MRATVQNSFGVNLFLLSIFGLYSREKPSVLNRVRSYITYFLLTYSIPTMGALYFLLAEKINYARVGDNAFLIAETACQIMKLWPFVRNGREIRKCIYCLESAVFAAANEEQKAIMNKCVCSCRKNSRVFLIAIIIGNISWAFTPLVLNESRLPLDVWLPFDFDSNLFAYTLVYILLVTGVAYVSLASAAIDPLIGGLAYFAATYVKILKNNFQFLEKPPNNDDIILVSNKIKEYIVYHRKILSFSRKIEDCFSFAVFGQFTGSVVTICFCCYQLSEVQTVNYNFLAMVCYFAIILAQIYFYCYYGSKLYEESDSLTDAIYMGQWYDYDIETKKKIIFIMELAKQPIVIRAGKILELSVVTFTTVLRRSYALLAVLKNQ